VVEKNPRKFALSDSEVISRKEFVNTVKLRIRELRSGLSNPVPTDDSPSVSVVTKKSKDKERQVRGRGCQVDTRW